MRLSTSAAAALLVLWANAASAQTAEEIVEKAIAALGGRAAHAKINSRVATGEITLATPIGDIKGSIETTNARPNKMRTVIKADLSAVGAGPLTMDQRFDGKTGYVLDTLQGNRDMAGGQLELQRNNSFPLPFVDYKDRGISVRLSGKEKVGAGDAFVLLFEPVSGPAVRSYIDAETFLPIRSVVKLEVPQLGQEVEQTTDISDYRDVDGVKVPFELRSSSTVQNFSIKLSKVEHNAKIDDTLFSKPAQ
jgi:hypothetical protein